MTLVKVASVNDLKDGEGRTVQVNGKAIALFRKDGTFFALDNTCLHQGGPLGEGALEGNAVVCPWHGWRYNIRTGISPVVSTVKVQTYQTKVVGQDVFVEV